MGVGISPCAVVKTAVLAAEFGSILLILKFIQI
jgi:hypothetical protein